MNSLEYWVLILEKKGGQTDLCHTWFSWDVELDLRLSEDKKHMNSIEYWVLSFEKKGG
jgi:hypothetical protein